MINDLLIKTGKSERDFYSHSYISLKSKYFFHSVGKAANSTVKHYLYTEELKGTGIKYKTVHDRLSSPLVSPYQLDFNLLSEVLFGRECFKFTFVRNPYSRILSCYLDRIQDMKSAPYRELVRSSGYSDGYKFEFSEFVALICEQNDKEQNNHWRLQYADAMCHLIDYDFIGRQETFNVDMNEVWKRIYPESKVKDFSSVNKSPSKTGSNDKLGKYWSDELIEKVSERYAKDFTYFGYSQELIL